MHEPAAMRGVGYRFVTLGEQLPGRESSSDVIRVTERSGVRTSVTERVTFVPRVVVTPSRRALSEDDWRRIDQCMDAVHFWDSAKTAVTPSGGGPFVVEGWRDGRYGVAVATSRTDELRRCRDLAADIVDGATTSPDGCRTLPLLLERWAPPQRVWSEAKREGKAQCQNHPVAVYEHCSGFNAITFTSIDTSDTRYYDGRTGRLVGAATSGPTGRRTCWGVVPQVRFLDCGPVFECGRP
jgi:hypothetical protein